MANIISASRIALSFCLLFMKADGALFLFLYCLCGVSDVLDGYIARKTNTQSDLGSRLDSIGDLFFFAVVLKLLLSDIISQKTVLICTLLIALVKTASVIVTAVRYKCFAVIHTFMNKITGILLFLYPFAVLIIDKTYVISAILSVAAVTAAEELAISITSKKLNANRKSIIFRE